jgi:allantoin racemase
MTEFIAVISPVVDTGAIDVDRTLAPFRVPGLSVKNFFLNEGPASIETEADIAECLPALLRTARALTDEGADAIVINCMCDPGLDELRATLNTVILGPAQTSMHIAASLAARFSVLDVLKEGREYVEQQIRHYGLYQSYASHRAIEVPVLELYRDPERTLAALETEARAAIERDAAGVLLFGCTGLAELAEALNDRLSASGERCRIIEPLRATIGVARTLLESGFSRQRRVAEQHR